MNIPKSIGLLLFVTVISYTSFAQCKFDKDEKDAFSGKHVRSVKHMIGSAYHFWWILMEQKGDKYYLTFQVAVVGKVDDGIPKGSKILIKLEDDKMVELEVDQDYLPIQNVEGAGTNNPFISSMWLPKGEIDESMMRRLSHSPITAIRVTIAGKDLDNPKITSKQSRKIQESAACLIDNGEEKKEDNKM